MVYEVNITTKSYRIPLFCTVTGLYWFSMYTYVPTLSTYAEGLGAPYALIGLIVGSYGFTQMLLRIPLGILSDRLNKRRIFITLGLALCFLSAFGMWISTVPSMLLIFRAVSGAAAASWVIFTVLFSSYFESNEAPRAIGFISSVTSIGQMAAIFVGGVAAQLISPRAPFLLAFIGAAAAIALSFGLKENTGPRKEPMKIASLLSVARNPGLLFLSVLAIFSQFMTFSTIYGFTPVAAGKLGASDFQLGLLTTLSTMPGIFGAALSGSFFVKKLGERRTLVCGYTISAVTCFIIPFLTNMPQLYVSQIIGGFCLGTVFPLLMGMCIKNVQESMRATAMGFFQAIYGIGMFVGPMVVGFLSDTAGMSWGFWTTGLVGFLAAAFSFKVAAVARKI